MERIFLSGPMGAGKSTVGRRVAARLGRPFIDLDQEIVARAGRSIFAIFASDGEEAFRAMERRAIRSVAEGTVVALGGGTVCHRETRQWLLAEGQLFTLMTDVPTLLSRVRGGEGRPLLAGSPEERLRALLQQRADAYGECHARIDAGGEPDAVAAKVVARAEEKPLMVALGARSYSVDVGPGVRRRVDAMGRPDMEVADGNTAQYARSPVVLAPGEVHKNIDAVACIWDAALDAQIHRQSLLLGVGGGVVGDLTGFAAATLLRGVRFGLVATSVVAMVDSSVGGKTGFNRTQGKNLVGAFHQPSFVLCDTETLATLPEEEYRAGLGEVVKSAWLAGPNAVRLLEESAEAIRQRDPQAIEAAVRMSIRLKADIVARDEREGGVRMLLNLGHTLGHAYEAQDGFGALRHGDAVALGLCAATRVARHLGFGKAEDGARLIALLQSLGLPTDDRARTRAETFEYVKADKKRGAAGVRFVVPAAPGATRFATLRIEELQAALSS